MADSTLRRRNSDEGVCCNLWKLAFRKGNERSFGEVKTPSLEWTLLHPDLLHVIAKKLPDIYSFIRFRAVCKKWRASVSLSEHPPLLPWLLDWDDMSFGNRHFYCVQHHKSHTIEIPMGLHRFEPSASYGFVLLTWKNKIRDSISLLNPFTGVRIDLPFEYGECNMFLKPVCIGRNPSRGNGELVMYVGVISELTIQLSTYVVIWQPNKNAWAKVKIPRVRPIGPVGYCNGRIFLHDHDSQETIVVNVETGVVMSEIPRPNELSRLNELTNFVETSAELLGIVKVFGRLMDDCHFEIYRLEEIKEGSWRWVKLSGIGDLMLFLSGDGGIAVPSSGIEGARGNCIFSMEFYDRKYVLVRYDVAEGRAEVLPRPTDCYATWLIPALY